MPEKKSLQDRIREEPVQWRDELAVQQDAIENF